MLIKYTGHACFKIRDNETGYSLVFDPYEPDSVPGFGKVVDIASRVICSHEHFDHNSRDSVQIVPSDADPFDVRSIDTWHDPEKGALRGPNSITVVTDRKTGEKVIHYGDIGEKIDGYEFFITESTEKTASFAAPNFILTKNISYRE